MATISGFSNALLTRLIGLVAANGVIVITGIACVNNENHETNIAKSNTVSASSLSSVSSPPSSSDNGIVIVPGPNPRTIGPASIPDERVVPKVPGKKCGPTQGPDGSLELVILKGNVTCDSAKNIAKEYGPLIVTGQNQNVRGWTCGPTDAENILAACAKGQDVFVFQPYN